MTFYVAGRLLQSVNLFEYELVCVCRDLVALRSGIVVESRGQGARRGSNIAVEMDRLLDRIHAYCKKIQWLAVDDALD